MVAPITHHFQSNGGGVIMLCLSSFCVSCVSKSLQYIDFNPNPNPNPPFSVLMEEEL